MKSGLLKRGFHLNQECKAKIKMVQITPDANNNPLPYS